MKRDAFALSIVLWIVAALLFATAMLGVLSKDTLKISYVLNDKLKSKLIADDILESVKFYVLTGNYDNISYTNSMPQSLHYKLPERIVVDNSWHTLDKSVRFKIQDTSALLNITNTYGDKLAYLCTTNMQRQLFYTIKDSLKDWKDKDNAVSLNGAENSHYSSKKFSIRNADAIQNLDELRVINGLNSLDQHTWDTLQNRFYYGYGAQANLALLDEKYLSYLLKINISQSQALINLREKNLTKFIFKVNNLKTYNNESMGFHLSQQFKIAIEVKINDAKSIINTTIRFRNDANRLYTVYNYKNF